MGHTGFPGRRHQHPVKATRCEAVASRRYAETHRIRTARVRQAAGGPLPSLSLRDDRRANDGGLREQKRLRYRDVEVDLFFCA